MKKVRLKGSPAMNEGLLGEDELKMGAEHSHWSQEEIDSLLDAFFSGANMKRLAVKYKRTPRAVLVRIGKILYNDRGQLTKYQPVRRVSRVGKKLTRREKNFLKIAQEKGYSAKDVAKVLARSEEEVEKFLRGDAKPVIRAFRDIAPSIDLLMAAKYLEEKEDLKILDEKDWKRLIKEEQEFGVDPDLFLSRPVDEFPPYIPPLAEYFKMKCQGKPYIIQENTYETREGKTV